MLTFFRKVRKSLVTSSSFRKYILYAIGEILLVMVGILLALQVNNWNEGRIKKNKIKLQMTTLSEDLKRDSIHFIDLIESYEDKVNVLQGINQCYYNIFNDASDDICMEEILLASSTFTNIKNTDKTIIQLKNSEGMDILDADDANLILDYDFLLIDYKVDETTVFQELQTSLRSLAAKFVNYGSYRDGKRVINEPLIIYNEIIINEFFNILRRYLTYCEANLRRLKVIKNKSIEVRNHLIKKYNLKS